ncbi:hypothetical protein TEA_002817 [Camellia sinensis var. sinensis]|uniref:Uncharacterized protein n=1 Tax=Camellia sinensis var. sinensis TaxID=542762 RepID=A0A4S4D135_CAMSN|nr:hypothetical protein TEA_002817 [Camellia sinensis var. sinensis]
MHEAFRGALKYQIPSVHRLPSFQQSSSSKPTVPSSKHREIKKEIGVDLVTGYQINIRRAKEKRHDNEEENSGSSHPFFCKIFMAFACKYLMPTELAGSSGQQLGGVLQRKQSNDNLFPQNTALVDEQSSDMNQNSIRRRYVSMQNSQTSLGVEVMHNVSGHGVNNLKQEFANPNGFGDVSRCEIPNYFNAFMSPSNSASSTFNAPHTDNIDKVSSVVSMLKGTLQHKKLNNETVEDSSLELYGAQEFLGDMSLNQGQGNRIHETSRTIQDVSSVQVNDHGVLEAVEGSLDVDLDGFVNPTNPMQMSMVSREPSQSESSAAAPAVSTGFDVCDEPTNLGQTMSIGESSKKQVGNGRSSENGTRAKDIKERIDDNLKDDQKPRRCLVRYGSVTSAGSVEKGDPTKKRRVERSRKMAEAKERNLTPPIPSDMQSILKRCENLEKEVRSLKLNLSFMNRKDSEQTKQIEELQKQNEELTEDKEHLLEEIERIIAEPGKMVEKLFFAGEVKVTCSCPLHGHAENKSTYGGF